MATSEELSADHQRNDEISLPPLSPRASAPWLVYQHGKNRKFQTFYNISDNPFNKSYNKFIPELSGKKFWQKNSHQGWLIGFSIYSRDPKFKYRKLFLWNPASLETIRLPMEPSDLVRHGRGYGIKDCVLSSPPQISKTSTGSSSSGKNVDFDSMVYILYVNGENLDVLVYCHPGEKKWRKHQFLGGHRRDHLTSMFFFKGKLFIMCSNYGYIEVAIQHGSDIEDAETLSVSDATGFNYNFLRELVVPGLERHRQLYYIESFGEVFQICRFYFPRGTYENCVTSILVAKLDFSSMTWEEVKSMDDYVFFLSENTQLSCLASELGLSKGYVYYTAHDEEISLYKYDLEDNSILLPLPCANLSAPCYAPEWLMISATPRFNHSVRTTDHVLGKDEHIHKVIRVTENRTVDKDGENKKQDVKEARPWIMLSDDHMVWLISNYLHPLDYVHLRGVSKKYRTMLDLRRSSSTRTVQTTDLSPWLVFPKHQAVYNYINPMHNKENYLMNIPNLLKGFRIRFSKGGWLLLSKGKTLFFYNPFTRSTVKLPVLPDSYHHYAFTGISFSSLPTSSDCVVFGIGKEFDCDWIEILSIQRGDQSWTHNVYNNVYLHPGREPVYFQLTFNNPVFFCGVFYSLDINGILGVFKFGSGISWEVLAMVAPPNCEFIYKSFLVECDGKLMSVLLGHLGKWVRIFRLNETDMIWVEVKHLGQHMLCISNTSCVSAMAPTSRMENKIYFPRLHNEGILYYSLDTGLGG
ncbi:uncharacterized protein LOC113310418 isoform X3 [Papaver somniferum]|uniref:uncharacterized protein LOC113310418 isoform X3 n=1 Tax=Papaver somniferum TaxID=3469 RepID=UPI000E6FF7B3|nr:uncharacterized protein LOC113310418 isoform X3 [Papaver somniferum]